MRGGATEKTALGLAVALFALTIAFAAGAAGRVEDKKRGISLALTSPLGYGSYVPTRFTLENRGVERRLDLIVQHRRMFGDGGGSHRVALRLPPGTTRLELPVLNQRWDGRIEVVAAVDGREAPALATSDSVSGFSASRLVVIALGKGLDVFVDQTLDGSDIIPVRILPRDAPRHWQGYVGRKCVVMLLASTVGELDGAQKRALAHWVSYGGGTLWILEEDGVDAAPALGLVLGRENPPPDMTHVNMLRARSGGNPPVGEFPQEAVWYRSLTGSVVLSPLGGFTQIEPEHLEVLLDEDSPTALTLGIHEHSNDPVVVRLFQNLHEVPRAGFSILSILLGLLIGPVNLIFLRRKKRLALFYVTAPTLALGGMIALGGYAFASEGFRLKINDTALLLHDLDRNEGALYRARGFYGPFAPRGGIRLSTATAAIPFHEETSDRGGLGSWLSTDWTAAQTLEDGWIRSRELSGLITAAPGRVRVGLRPVIRGSGDVRVVSELSGPARQVWVRIPEGPSEGMYFTEEVTPGREARLRRKGSAYNGDNFPFVMLSDLDWIVAAQTDWLPGLENGKVDGKVLAQEYYYVGMRAPASPSPPAPEPLAVADDDGEGTVPSGENDE